MTWRPSSCDTCYDVDHMERKVKHLKTKRLKNTQREHNTINEQNRTYDSPLHRTKQEHYPSNDYLNESGLYKLPPL